MRGEKKVNHRCGGVLTLLAFLIIGAAAVVELLKVFKKTSIITSQEVQFDFTSAFVNITTYQNDPNMHPFMIALDIRNGPNGVQETENY